MRLPLALVAALVLSLEPGCAHFSTASEPTMVELSEPSSPPPVLPSREHWARRKSLLATGIAIGSIGAALTLGGAIGYAVAKRDLENGEAACRQTNSVDGFNCLHPLQAAADIDTMIAGGVHMGLGLVFTLVGLSRHD
jgi:hypothetical protein